MNSAFLRVLAILMMVAAVVTAYLGYKSSQQPPEKIEVVIPAYSQVVARNDISIGHVLTMEDLEVTTTQQQDQQTFSDLQSLLGKIPVIAVRKGEAFRMAHFPATSLLGQALAPHERAVAIKVNEVIGVGGFIKPGDHVDVLLYLRTDRETGDVSSAQVVLANVKVLAYGALIGETESGKNETLATSGSNNVSGSINTSHPARPGAESNPSGLKNARDSRSAILAVPAQDVSKLMLADSTGVLRLALRNGVPDVVAETAVTDTGTTVMTDNHFIRLGDISRPSSQSLPKSDNSKTLTKASVKKSSITPATQRMRVIVHHGDKQEIVHVAK